MLDRDLAELYVIKVTKCDHKELEVTNCDIKLGGRLKKLVTNLSPTCLTQKQHLRIGGRKLRLPTPCQTHSFDSVL